MKKYYIAGQITGKPDYKKDFEAARAEILAREPDAVVFNPADLPEGADNRDYIDICLAMINAADTVVFIEGWHRSRGASLEYEYSLYKGKDMIVKYLKEGKRRETIPVNRGV